MIEAIINKLEPIYSSCSLSLSLSLFPLRTAHLISIDAYCCCFSRLAPMLAVAHVQFINANQSSLGVRGAVSTRTYIHARTGPASSVATHGAAAVRDAHLPQEAQAGAPAKLTRAEVNFRNQQGTCPATDRSRSLFTCSTRLFFATACSAAGVDRGARA